MMRPHLILLAIVAALSLVAVASAVASMPYMRSFDSFADLRAATPSTEGELVYLISYNSGKYKGGGMFIGSLTAGTDDGGMVASSGAAYHWTRNIEDFETLNVLHFGAFHDGSTDDNSAVMAMWKWSQAQTDSKLYNGVRLVEGAIYMSALDLSAYNISYFALFGPTAPYGVSPLTTITSDKSLNPVFKLCAQTIVMRGILWNGRVVGSADSNNVPVSQSNYQPFLKNIYVGNAGQTVRVMTFQGQNSGGHIFDLLNTYQCKFEQVYSYTSFGNVWNVGWSGADGTYWDHPRSVEISNVNIQQSYSYPGPFNMPRMEQGTLRNVWLEHSRIAGDISSGSWLIDALNIESTILPLHMNGTRDLTRQLSLQSGSSILRGTEIDDWLKTEDAGWIRQEAHGIMAAAPVASIWEASMLRGSNTASTAIWLALGTFQTQQVGGIWEIEVISKVGTDPATGVRPTSNGAPGITRIYMQRSSGTTPIMTFSCEGYTGVLSAGYKGNYGSYNDLYIKIAANVQEYAVFFRSTGVTHFEGGAWNMLSLDGTTYTTTPQYLTTVSGKASLHNGEAGFGAEGSVVTVDTVTLDTATVNTTQIMGYMVQKINGVDYGVAYYALPEDYPQDPPQGVPPTLPPTKTPTGAAASQLPSAILALIAALVVFL